MTATEERPAPDDEQGPGVTESMEADPQVNGNGRDDRWRVPYQFFRTLYRQEVPGGCIVLSHGAKPGTHKHFDASTDEGFVGAAHQAIAFAHDEPYEPGTNVWFNACLQDGAPRDKGYEKDAYAVPGLWSDIDLKDGPVERLDRFPLRPTALVETGGGLHPWWLFESVLIMPADTRAAWISRVKAANDRLRAVLGNSDNVSDLARSMRVPGTFNYKPIYGKTKPPVRLVYRDGPRYTLEELEEALGLTAATAPETGGDAAEPGLAALSASVEVSIPNLVRWAVEQVEKGGERNNIGYRLAMRLIEGGYGPADGELAMRGYQAKVEHQGDHAYTWDEAEKTLHHAYRKHREEQAAATEAEVHSPESLLRAYSLADVVAEPDLMTWLVKGWWPHPSYGEVAGAEKTLKSYLSTLTALSVASGRPLLDHFPVVTPGPVLVFTGEGSRKLWVRRARHLARGMGMSEAELVSLPIRLVDDVAPVLSPRFLGTLVRELDAELAPVLVQVDPLYAYHGSEKAAGNVHEAAEVLTAMSQRTQAAGASLQVVNHFTKAGAKVLSLASITQAGGREWSDSWALVAHREAPVLAAGSFRLALNVGSRQWGGRELGVDLELGAFDEETFTWNGEPSWVVHTEGSAGVRPPSVKEQILCIVNDFPFELTKTDILNQPIVEGGKGKKDAAFKELEAGGAIVSERREKREGDRNVKRAVWGVPMTGQ